MTNRREKEAAERETARNDESAPAMGSDRPSASPQGLGGGSRAGNRPPQSQNRSGPSQRSSGGPLRGRKGTAADALRIFAGLGG